MRTTERIKLCRIIEKMEGKDKLPKRLGMNNVSLFKHEDKTNSDYSKFNTGKKQ